MKFEEIKQLHEMGFSADQIMQLRGGDPEPSEDTHQEEPETEPTEPAEQEPENTPDLGELQQQISSQQAQIEKLTKQLQQSNRQNMRVNTIPQNDLDTQVDKIMGELIRPSIKEEK